MYSYDPVIDALAVFLQSEAHEKWHCTKQRGCGDISVAAVSSALAGCFYYWNLLSITLKIKQPFVLLCLKQDSVFEVFETKDII